MSSDPIVALCVFQCELCAKKSQLSQHFPPKIKEKNRNACWCLIGATKSVSHHRVHVSNGCENVQFPLCSFCVGQFSLSLLPTLCLTSTPLTRARQSSGMWKQPGFFSPPIVLSTKPAWRRKTKSSGIAWQRWGRSLPLLLVHQWCPVLVFYDRGAYKGCI